MKKTLLGRLQFLTLPALLFSCVVTAGLTTGCGDDEVAAFIQQLPVGTVTVFPGGVRPIPSGTTEIRLTGFVDGIAIFGPTALPVGNSVLFPQVPTAVNSVLVEYLSNGAVIATFSQPIVVPQDGNVDVFPNFVDAPGPISSLRNVGTSGIRDMYFVNNLIGWIVGDNGQILKTTDGGLNWEFQNSPTNQNLTSVFFISPTQGYITGPGNFFLRTTDGGATWQQSVVESNGLVGVFRQFQAIRFLNNSTGYVVGERTTPAVNKNVFYRTTNGGATWTQVANPGPTNGSGAFDAVALSAAGVQFAAADNGRIFRSDDNGQTWNQTGVGDGDLSNATDFRGIDFEADGIEGYVVGLSGVIRRTADGNNATPANVDWIPPAVNPAVANLNGVAVASDNVAVAVGDNESGSGTVVRTVDGGVNWTRITTNIPDVPLESVRFVNANLGFIRSRNGGILLRTNDGGATWTPISTPPSTNNLHDVVFSGLNDAWVVGDNGTVLRTANGGGSFTAQAPSTNVNFFGVDFVNAQVGYIVGAAGQIDRTANGGTNWAEVDDNGGQVPNTIQLNDVDAVSEQLAFVVGDNVGGDGTICVTTNGGTSWTRQVAGLNQDLNGVFMINATTGFVVGDDGAILRTGDGGANWVAQVSPVPSEDLRDVFFYQDDQRGWVVGQNGTILTTVDGGTNWVFRTSGTFNNLTGVFFLSELLGVAVGENGTFLQTSDGGVTWNQLSTGTTQALRGLFVNPDRSGLSVGDGGTIFRLNPPTP